MNKENVEEVKLLSKEVYFILVEKSTDENQVISIRQRLAESVKLGLISDIMIRLGFDKEVSHKCEYMLDTQEKLDTFVAFIFLDWRSRGGKREGAGRKPKGKTAKVQVSYTLDEDVVKIIRSYPNQAEFIESAIKEMHIQNGSNDAKLS